MKERRFRIELATRDDASTAARLRRLLKFASRSLGLRCVEAHEVRTQASAHRSNDIER